MPHPGADRPPLAIRLAGRLLRAGQPRAFLRLRAALPRLRRGHARVVQRRVAAQPPHERDAPVQVSQQALGGVTAVPDERKAPAGEPGQHLGEQLPRQLGTTGLALARQVQPGQQGQRQDGDAGAGQADGHGQDHPVVAAGGGHALLRRGHGVAEPAEAPHAPTALMSQRIVHQERDRTGQREATQDQDADVIGKSGRCPGRALEEVIIGVQAVALRMIGEYVRMDLVCDPAQGPSAQTHNPRQQELAVGNGRGLREDRGQGIDDRCQGWYHGPHGGTSHSLRPETNRKDRRNPLCFHPSSCRRCVNVRSCKTATVQG